MEAAGPRAFYTYIMASSSHTLYVGMTSDLEQRIFDHKNKTYVGFTSIYDCDRLVWCESHETPDAASNREKQLKGWKRAKTIELIKAANPAWADLSEAWDKSPKRP